MCGIVGYVGERDAKPILLNCLKRLEYRGYDSCGIAIVGGRLKAFKNKGRVNELEKTLPEVKGKIGIGHTRWATHGEPSEENAHPHTDCEGKIAVVHNGIITNFLDLRERLSRKGHKFRSETDTEVIPHLVEDNLKGSLLEAVEEALSQMKGSYAFAVIMEGHEGIICARKESPLIIGIGDGEFFLSSDIPGVLGYSDRVLILEDNDLAVIDKNGIRIFNRGREVARKIEKIQWTLEEAEKGGFEHFMLKEIYEEPRMLSILLGEKVSFTEPSIEMEIRNRDFSEVLLTGCGTSYHASLIGKFYFEAMGIPARVELASELGSSGFIPKNSLVVAVTQSGETMDTLRALKKAKERGLRTLAITNVVESSITRIADEVLYIRAGPEICVAATKSFLAQLLCLYLLSLYFGEPHPSQLEALLDDLARLPSRMEEILEEAEIKEISRLISRYESMFFVGRGINFPTALEGALKMKEISYIHAEGCPAGELKHGPLALLTEKTPVVGVLSHDGTYESSLSNLKEIKARKSPLIVVCPDDEIEAEKCSDQVIKVPQINPYLFPFTASVALQLLAYHVAHERGCEIDYPRNLAKSVTVE